MILYARLPGLLEPRTGQFICVFQLLRNRALWRRSMTELLSPLFAWQEMQDGFSKFGPS